MKFAILLKLILMLEEYGKQSPVDRKMEFVNIWEETIDIKDQ